MNKKNAKLSSFNGKNIKRKTIRKLQSYFFWKNKIYHFRDSGNYEKLAQNKIFDGVIVKNYQFPNYH